MCKWSDEGTDYGTSVQFDKEKIQSLGPDKDGEKPSWLLLWFPAVGDKG